LVADSEIPLAKPRIRVHAPEPVSEPVATPTADSTIRPGPDDCGRHPGTKAQLLCKQCHQKFCLACALPQKMGRQVRHFCPQCRRQCVSFADLERAEKTKPLTFAQSVPGALKYPFVGNGPLLLVGGTVFAVIIQIMSFGGRISLLVSGFALGYLIAYMQKILQSSGQGDKEMPTWPDLSDFFADIIQPIYLYFVTMVFCLGPAILGYLYGNPLVGLLLLVLGLIYLPMALLAVGMSDDLTGLNPLFAISSMLKIPGDYALACATFLGTAALFWGMARVVRFIPIPILPGIIAIFVNLLALTIQMRILGLLYFTNQRKMGW
jgi:hypothetical protein